MDTKDFFSVGNQKIRDNFEFLSFKKEKRSMMSKTVINVHSSDDVQLQLSDITVLCDVFFAILESIELCLSMTTIWLSAIIFGWIIN